MLTSVRFATVISLTGTRVSVDLVTSRYGCNVKVLSMLLAQRDTATEKPEFHRIATDRGTCVLDFGALHEPKHHQALDLRVRGIDCLDNAFLAAFQGGQCAAISCHNSI